MQNTIKLFIASSLDGYIARKNGSIDWLESLKNPDNLDHGYGEFINNIDTIIMGRKSYEKIISFGIDWPYPDCKSYIITSQEDYKVSINNCFVKHNPDAEFIDQLRTKSNKNIWVLGGSELIKWFLNHHYVDEMIISIIPVIIGTGIPLFLEGVSENWFNFEKTETFNTGVVNLHCSKNT